MRNLSLKRVARRVHPRGFRWCTSRAVSSLCPATDLIVASQIWVLARPRLCAKQCKKQREAAFSCSGRNRFNSSSFFSEWMDHERVLAIYQQLACVPRTLTKRGLQPSGSNHTNLSLQLEGNHHPIPAVQTYMARFWQSLESKMCLQQKI